MMFILRFGQIWAAHLLTFNFKNCRIDFSINFDFRCHTMYQKSLFEGSNLRQFCKIWVFFIFFGQKLIQKSPNFAKLAQN